MQAQGGTTVEDFLAEEQSGSQLLTDLARVLEIGGIMVVVGTLAFALVCLPHRRLTLALENMLLVAGLAVAIGAVAEISSLATVFDLDFTSLLDDRRLDGAQFRAVGGVVLCFSLLAPARWRQLPLLFGAILSAASFGLDGHSVTEGPRYLMVSINLAHVLAAGVWTGGVLALLVFVQTNSDSDTDPPIDTAPPIDVARKFGSLAAIVLLPVLVAGVVMAFLVLDEWSDLLNTRWGQLLIAKLAVVGGVLTLGAHHRFRVLPRLDQPRMKDKLRQTLTAEVLLMLAVVAITGFLVSAATV